MRTHTIRVDPYGRVVLTTSPDGNRPGIGTRKEVYGNGRIHVAITALTNMLREDHASIPDPLPRTEPEMESDFRYGGTDPDGEAA